MRTRPPARQTRRFASLIMLVAVPILAACGATATETDDTTEATTAEPDATAETDPAAAGIEGDIDIYVAASPGGGFDTMARTIAPYLEDALPGTRVTVRNVPGGNGEIFKNHVLSADPTGTSIGIFNIPGMVVPQVVGDDKYDLTKVEWLGTSSRRDAIAAASPNSNIESLADLEAAGEFSVAVTSLIDSAAVGAQIMLADLGLDDRATLVSHDGSSEAKLSAIRGDTDYLQFPYTVLRDEVADGGGLIPLWVYSEDRNDELPDVPTFEEVGGDPALLNATRMFHAFGTTPGTPESTMAVLRSAFAEVMQNAQVVSELTETKQMPHYEGPDETREIVNGSIELLSQYASLFE